MNVFQKIYTHQKTKMKTSVYKLDKQNRFAKTPSVARKKARKIFWICESFYEKCEEF